MKKPQSPIDALNSIIEEAGSQRIAAKQLKISPQYLHDILNERRSISSKVAKALGFEKLTVFTKKG